MKCSNMYGEEKVAFTNAQEKHMHMYTDVYEH
jgi:hypothetical protein